jgi:hypothetical protein
MTEPVKLTLDSSLEIEGREDTTQLVVQGHITQTEPLQVWQNAVGDAVAELTAEGGLRLGQPGAGAPAAIVEANADITLPSTQTLRGWQSLGTIAGSITDVIRWAVQELTLRGQGSISGLHSTLRAQITIEDDDDPDLDATLAELHAAEFEVINRTGSETDPVGRLVAVQAVVTNDADAVVDEVVAIEVAPTVNGTNGIINTFIGLDIADVPETEEPESTFALRTGTGVVQFGDVVDMTAHQIQHLAAPVEDDDAATKQYVDELVAGAPQAAEDVSYSPTTAADWDDPDPAEVKAALDQLAERTKDLESGEVNSLDDLTDVAVTSPAQGDILTRNGTQFANQNIGSNEVVMRGGSGDVDGLAMPASSILARLASGDIVAATVSQIKALVAMAFSDISGTLGISQGGTGQTTATAAFDALDPTTTQGDIITNDGSNAIRQPIGTNEVVYRAGSGNVDGLAMGASTILARLASGDIVAATVSQIKTLLAYIASNIGYTPSESTDWPGTDPDDTAEGLDRLAERVTDLETSPPSHSHGKSDLPAATAYEDETNSFTQLQQFKDIELDDQDASPVADRRLRVIDGLIRATDTSNAEGQYLSADSIEQGAASGLDADTVDGQHAAAFAQASHAHDASVITFTPGDSSDWNSSADPGDVDDALNQLADRAKSLESAPPGHSHGKADLPSAAAYEDETNSFTQLQQFKDIELDDQDASPVADRRLRVIDGLIRTTNTSNVEGQYLSADSIEQGAASGLDADTVDGQHAAAFAQASHSHDASAITFTPGDTSDWSSSTDPGNVDDALDQLAERTTTLEDGEVHDLDDLTDVVVTSATQGDILTRNGTQFVNQNIGTNEVVMRSGSGDVDGLAMPASSILARLASGDIVAATVAQIKTLLALAFSDVSGTLGISQGGTGQTTATASFNALDPMTAQGDIITHDGTDSIRQPIGTNEVVMRGGSGDVDGLAMPASSILARLASGDIVAATVAQIKTLLALAFSDVSGTLGISQGGTGQTTATEAFDALDPTTTQGDIIVNNGTNAIRQPIGTNEVVYRAGSGNVDGLAMGASTILARLASGDIVAATVSQIKTLLGSPIFIAVLEDQKTSGTDGGTFTNGADQTRTLNTEVSDPDGIVSLSGNQFTLGAGTYILQWRAPAFRVNPHQSMLYSVTGSAVVQRGSSEFTDDGNSNATNNSSGTALVTTGGSTTYEIRHRCQTTRATDGFGRANTFGTQVYTRVLIIKIG